MEWFQIWICFINIVADNNFSYATILYSKFLWMDYF